MKKALFLVSGIAAAAVGFLVYNSRRNEPVEELAHRLEEAWADHHTQV
jgi:sugar phosphate permease